MQTLGTRFGTLISANKTLPLLRVAQGNLQSLIKGETLRIQIPEITHGEAKVVIQGKTITLEGLSQSMQGKGITVIVLKAGKHPVLEVQPASRQNKAQTQAAKQKAALPPGSLQTGVGQSGKAFTAQIGTNPPAWLRHAEQALPAIVSGQQGKRITLRIIPRESLIHSQSTEGEDADKQQQRIQIERPTRSMRTGEQFDIQLITSGKHGKTLLRLQPQTARFQPLSTPKSVARTFALSAGETIDAEVTQRLPGGRITFQWNNQSFDAPAPKHVQPGDMLHLQVAETKGKPSLKVLRHIPQAREKAVNIFRQHIGKTTPPSNALNTINRIATEIPAMANSVDPPSETTPTPQQLAASLSKLSDWIDNYAARADKTADGSHIATALRHLGQHYESNLLQSLSASRQTLQYLTQHDLKAILLELINISKQHDAASAAGRIGHAASQGAAHIESQQALNVIASLQDQPIRFDLPVFFAGQLSNVHLSIQQEQQQQHEHSDDHPAGSKAYNILFALELTGLGALRVDARITDKSVHARFYHDNDASRRFVQQHIQHLADKLESIGYQSIYIGTALGQQMNHEKQTQFAQLVNNAPDGNSLLDIRA